jgi:hypothetical protein
VDRTLLTPVDRRNPVRELAAPRAVGQIGQLALLATDLVLLGRLGATALGAAGLAVLLFNQLRTTGAGLVGAVGERVASAVTRAEARARAEVRTAVGLRAGSWRRSAEYEVRDLVRGAVAVLSLAGWRTSWPAVRRLLRSGGPTNRPRASWARRWSCC